MSDCDLPKWAQKTIVGYSDKISARPGESIDFMVSCEDGAREFEAGIVRLICGDHHPDGPGLKLEPVATPVDGRYEGRHQPIAIGSSAIVSGLPALADLPEFTILAAIWPTLPGGDRQTIFSEWDGETRCGFKLQIDAGGHLALKIGDGNGVSEILRTSKPVMERIWQLVTVVYDGQTREIRLFNDPLEKAPGLSESEVACHKIKSAIGRPGVPFVIAAHCAARAERGAFQPTECHYNGKIDSPRVVARAVRREALKEVLYDPLGCADSDRLVAAWDFSVGISTQEIVDRSPNQHHGHTVNLPTRGMTGYNWTGEVFSWAGAPDQYGAIHFHEDDLYDAQWKTSFSLEVPASLPSGIYAAHVKTEQGDDYIPFAVRAAVGKRTSDVCFLMSTATYMAYANSRVSIDAISGREFECGGLVELTAADLFLNTRREFGYSTYDTHRDGSGVCYSSRLRPILDMRPDAHISDSARWNLVADTHITDWLDQQGQGYDVVTDEDLDREGLSAIEGYRVVITGTHPEYCSMSMFEALRAYRDRGGRLMYLGGNGFYWRIAYHPDLPGVMEVRRAENGPRGWAAAPGEYYHSFTGEYGGLWRYQGRPPQALVGVGFSASGFDVSTHYRRQPGSYEQEASFIFKGVGENELIGTFGLAGGGAAGWETDIHDPSLMSPANSLLLASSEGHSNVYAAAPEDPNTLLVLDGTQNPKARADMVFFSCDNGGAVFSTGSIAWAAALSHARYRNNVSRITENVLKRFLSPDPF